MLTEILLTMLPDGAREIHSITELYEMYNRNRFMAMRYMGLVNIIASSILVLVYYALYGLYKQKLPATTTLAFILSLLGYAIFMAGNVSFAFIELADRYRVADSETTKLNLIAAGEALFAKGASHTPGTFPGFFIGETASILFSVIILRGGFMKKIVGITGIIAFSFLFIFEFTSSFVASFYEKAMIFAIIGGILALTWYGMIGYNLWKKVRNS
jgi:hypothetical protein